MDRMSWALDEFVLGVGRLGWVTDVFLGGSAATGDYRPGLSDLDLVALVDGPMNRERITALISLHRELDANAALGLALGCAYVDEAQLAQPAKRHPTWTHGALVQRVVSGVARAELLKHGHALLGRSPAEVLPPMAEADVRAAVRAELAGYWTWAVRRPWLWLDPVIADLGLTTMARARHALSTGELMTKSRAIDYAAAPRWLVDQLRARRNGMHVTSPRLRTGLIAWRDAYTTVVSSRNVGRP